MATLSAPLRPHRCNHGDRPLEHHYRSDQVRLHDDPAQHHRDVGAGVGEVRSIDSNETLSLKLKTRALLGMLPKKEEKEIKLRYVDLPNDLSYKVLRRKAEYWLESLHDQGPETSAHGPANRDKGKDEGPTKGQ